MTYGTTMVHVLFLYIYVFKKWYFFLSRITSSRHKKYDDEAFDDQEKRSDDADDGEHARV